jgi:hypothetical protein
MIRAAEVRVAAKVATAIGKFVEPEGRHDLGHREATIEAIRSVLYTFPSADRRLGSDR